PPARWTPPARRPPLRLHKPDAHRRADLHRLTRWRQAAGLLIDLENRDRVAVLVPHQHPGPARIDAEIAGRLAAGGGVTDRFELDRLAAVDRLDREAGDRV